MHSFYKNVGKIIKMRAETFAGYIIALLCWSHQLPEIHSNLQWTTVFLLLKYNISKDHKTYTEKSNIRNSQK